MIISAQGDIGANVSATNIKSIVHNWFEYEVQVEVRVFLECDKIKDRQSNQ